MLYAAPIDSTTLQQWVEAKLDVEAVEKMLKAKGLDTETIASHVKAFKRLRHAKRQFTGFICMGIGAFLGFVSCVLSIINPFPDLYNIILFGLTSLAILIICLGMYFVFE